VVRVLAVTLDEDVGVMVDADDGDDEGPVPGGGGALVVMAAV
jgi:hypothetical protein